MTFTITVWPWTKFIERYPCNNFTTVMLWLILDWEDWKISLDNLNEINNSWAPTCGCPSISLYSITKSVPDPSYLFQVHILLPTTFLRDILGVRLQKVCRARKFFSRKIVIGDCLPFCIQRKLVGSRVWTVGFAPQFKGTGQHQNAYQYQRWETRAFKDCIYIPQMLQCS